MTERAPIAGDTAYGQPISRARQEELTSLLSRGPAHPFAGVKLSGADVFWLLGVRQGGTPSLEGVHLFGAHLENAQLAQACLKRSNLIRGHFEGADLSGAQLESADLSGAYLLDVDLRRARLAGANLSVARLQGAVLEGADLQGAQLFGARLDSSTRLSGVRLGPGPLADRLDRLHLLNRNAALVGVRWQGANLESVPWDLLRRLGESHWPLRALYAGRVGATIQYLRYTLSSGRYAALARAYRQLADELRRQGLAEPGNRFADLARRQERHAQIARLLYGVMIAKHDR
jgi:uncharacterized protein YjbI with pentapeptide repeats